MTVGTTRPDLRMTVLAAAAWTGALAGFFWPAWLAVTAAAAAAVLGVLHRLGRQVLLASTCLAVAAAVGGSAAMRAHAVADNRVADLAARRSFVVLALRVTSDPVNRAGPAGPFLFLRGTATRVTALGSSAPVRVPVLVFADADWRAVTLGSQVEASGRLAPASGADLAAVVFAVGPPALLRPPPALLDAAAVVRAGVRAAVEPAPPAERALVPALVVGDDRGMPAALAGDFRVSGLTHLTAVSGTNLTLVVGFLLVVARRIGIRARGLLVVGVLGVVGFVLLARPEPSVLRAAAMGTAALVAMSAGGGTGARALGLAVFLLLLFDPWLAISPGFTLSALATAGILFLGPPWRDAMTAWLPRWAAEAVVVPLAAQLAATPVVAAISGQVSLVAVLANLLVAPVVGPVTVLGLVGGLFVLVLEPVGQLCGRLAGWGAAWIVLVAQRAAALPTPAVEWSPSSGALTVLVASCVVTALLVGRMLARPGRSLTAVAVLLTVLLRPLPTPGWPPPGWVMVACDVGQGDGLVLNAGGRRAVVVDAGPDPSAMDRCLDRTRVAELPVVVLSHFHADHIQGLARALGGRRVGRLLVTGLQAPTSGADAVRAAARVAGAAVGVPAYGQVGRAGEVTWQVVGPARQVASPGTEDEGTVVNNASLVLVAAIRGVRILLSGDVEQEAQQRLARSLPGLDVDVLKVPHHGSRNQDGGFLSGTGARLALISVGQGNDYGHPAPETVDLLRRAGMLVRRTDQSGDLAVVKLGGRLQVVTRR